MRVFGNPLCALAITVSLRSVVLASGGQQPFNEDALSRECDAGNAVSCFSIGEHYRFGDKSTEPKAVSAYAKACATGMLVACTRQGQLLHHRGTDESYAQAVGLFRNACDQGSTEACGDLGTMYIYGRGVPEDSSLAAPLLVKGCDGGDGAACNKAGVLYGRGDGVTRNSKTAFELYTKGCEQRIQNADACTNLAGYYADGEVVPKDIEKAKKLYRVGCETVWSATKEIACNKLSELSR